MLTNPGGTLVQADGSFELDPAAMLQIAGGTLVDGAYALRLTARDNLDHESQTTVTFTVDTVGPVIEMFKLRRSSDSPPLGDNLTDRAQVELEGRTEPLAFIELSEPFGVAYTQADETGYFAFVRQDFNDIPPELGENILTLKAFDAVDNLTELELTRIAGDSVVRTSSDPGLVP